jgi:hypothetical protein
MCFSHVRYLNLAANMDYIFDIKLKKDKRKNEYENDLQNFKKIERFKNVEKKKKLIGILIIIIVFMRKIIHKIKMLIIKI